MSWSPPHPKDLTEEFVGQKESPHTQTWESWCLGAQRALLD